jgi:hypothetical protein
VDLPPTGNAEFEQTNDYREEKLEMKRVRTQLHVLPADKSVIRAFRTGVSLHSHTEHSQERLNDLPEIVDKMPVVANLLRSETERYRQRSGKAIDFSRVYWRGPACARSAHDLERGQIERLGLAPLVSLTDHDDIEAGLLLQDEDVGVEVPVSVEWSVPYGETHFHLGIHNLPVSQARALMGDMAEYTARPEPDHLRSLLERFNESPEMLVVLNHPFWDIGRIGTHGTVAAADSFLQEYGHCVHALEINGLRAWSENLAVAQFAAERRKVVVSGGDRHGLEPNATVNLTRALTFAEFVSEIREDASSDVAVLEQYGEPLLLRHLLTAWDIVRDHPHLEAKRAWAARVYVEDENGIERPLCGLWSRAPRWIDPCLNVVGLLSCAPLRAAGRLAGLGARSTV